MSGSFSTRRFDICDEKSIDFSVDPDMYQKLGIKKARKGEEMITDIEKLNSFQLKKDIEKIVKVRGSYEHRNQLYLQLRAQDPYYNDIAALKTFAADGKFEDINELTKDSHWKQTSKPHGEMAHKRYLHYLESLPNGPSEAQIKDQMQREMDDKLHQKIM